MAEETLNASSHIVEEQSESVAASNLKVVGDTPAYMAGLGYAQALHHQGLRHQQDLDAAAAWRAIAQSAVAGSVSVNQAVVTKSVEDLLATSVREGASGLLAMAAGTKAVQTIPPVTTPAPVV